MKIHIINILIIILAFTIQSCIFPLIPVLAATPNLLLIVTFSLGFIHGKEQGMFYGLFTGILMDLFYSGPFGFYTLLFTNIGYFNGKLTKTFYVEDITLPLGLSLTNGIIYNLYIYVFRYLIRGKLDFMYYFINIILPGTIFTVVTTLFIYHFFLFTNRRMEEFEKRRD